MRPTVRIFAGVRGSWIAGRYPQFSWLLEDVAVGDDAWDDGTPVERIAWLRQTRAIHPSRPMAAIEFHGSVSRWIPTGASRWFLA